MTNDNIISGPWTSWNPPYYFIVGRRRKWNPTADQQIVDIVDNAALAYSLFSQSVEQDNLIVEHLLWEWFITDSFNRPALSYCKTKYEEHMSGVTAEEIQKKT